MVSASAWIICVLTKNNFVSGDRKTREPMLIPILKRLTWHYFTIWGIQWEILHQWWQNTLLYNVGYTASLISLFESSYAIDYDLLMLFRRSILVPCHQQHWKYRTGWNHFGSLLVQVMAWLQTYHTTIRESMLIEMHITEWQHYAPMNWFWKWCVLQLDMKWPLIKLFGNRTYIFG